MDATSRRSFLKGLGISVPAVWVLPMVQSVTLPVHAAATVEVCQPSNLTYGPLNQQCEAAEVTIRYTFSIDEDPATCLGLVVNQQEVSTPAPAPGASVPLTIDLRRENGGIIAINVYEFQTAIGTAFGYCGDAALTLDAPFVAQIEGNLGTIYTATMTLVMAEPVVFATLEEFTFVAT